MEAWGKEKYENTAQVICWTISSFECMYWQDSSDFYVQFFIVDEVLYFFSL